MGDKFLLLVFSLIGFCIHSALCDNPDVAGSTVFNAPSVTIINGHEAQPYSAPFMVGILLKADEGQDSFCGGSLISRNYVLTAAHCLVGFEEALLIMAVHNWTDQDEPYRYEVSVRKDAMIPHEHTNVPEHLHDIGLIRLPHAITPSEYIQIIPLPSRSDAPSTYVGQVGRAYGWGMTHDLPDPQVTDISQVLQYVDVEVISKKECRRSYDLKQGTLCTSGKGIKATCSGDSGGPFVVDGVEIALTSYGKHDCVQKAPSVYTNIGDYLDWIASHSDVVIE